MTKKERFECCVEWFSVAMPEARTELHYVTEWGLLVAVVLSAQCTDKRVNMVTPALMAAFPTPEAMAAASVEQIFAYIKSISYPNAKAEHLFRTATLVTERCGGEVPATREGLEALPGVGRKTANVMLSVIHGQPTMAVDTHVYRVSRRIGLSAGTTPLAVEQDLMRGFPAEIIPLAHHWLILHGRYMCTARDPKCEKCGLTKCCNYFLDNKTK